MTQLEAAELKIKCLELTKELSGRPEDWTAAAKKLYDFITKI